MEIFKIFESTIANVQPGHHSTKDLRRDQLLDNYDEATKTLQTLIKAKENEIAYRRDLVEMLEKSKTIYDNKLVRVKQAYQTAKKHAPDTLDLKVPSKRASNESSSSALTATTSSNTTFFSSMAAASSAPIPTIVTTNSTPNAPSGSQNSSQQQQLMMKGHDLDIPLPSESFESRSSLDRRLSEFLKTFPNLTQAGLAPALPGYYTQQPPPPPPPIAVTPPLMAMMRFPPPTLIPPSTHHQSKHQSKRR